MLEDAQKRIERQLAAIDELRSLVTRGQVDALHFVGILKPVGQEMRFFRQYWPGPMSHGYIMLAQLTLAIRGLSEYLTQREAKLERGDVTND